MDWIDPSLGKDLELRGPILADPVNYIFVTLLVVVPTSSIANRRWFQERTGTDFCSSGKLFGLHSGRGSIVWQTILNPEIPLTKLFLWQTPLEPTVAPKLLVLGTSKEKTHLITVDAHNGQVVSEDTLEGTVVKVIIFDIQHHHVRPAEKAIADASHVPFWSHSCADSISHIGNGNCIQIPNVL